MAVLDARLAGEYLAHLGVAARPGTVDAALLETLVRAHLERVPYENLDILLGRPPGIDPGACVERVVAGRGGYCFHLNGAFVELLRWLEVDVTPHVSGVQGAALAEAPGPNANHLGVTVTTPDGALWLVDVGLGDGPAAPLPFAHGVYTVDGFSYRLGPSPFDPAGWRLEHDPRGSFVLVDFASAPATTDDFRAMHTYLSTSSESRFAVVPTVQRRDGRTVEFIRGCVHTRLSATASETRTLTTSGEWWELAVDGFGLAYGDLRRDERDRVWTLAREAHEKWEAEQAAR